MVPGWSLGGWGHPWNHGSSWYVTLDSCSKFWFSSMIRSLSRNPPHPEVIFGGHWWFLTGVLVDEVILDIIDHHDMWLLTCVPNVIYLAWLEVCQEPPDLEVILGGRWWFLIRVLKDVVIFDIIDHLDRPKWFCTETFIKIRLHLAEIMASGG